MALNWQIPAFVRSFEEYRKLAPPQKKAVAERFAVQFKRAKKACAFSYRALAELLGCEYTAPAQWARARWIPQTHNLRELANVCGVDVDWFFGDQPHPLEGSRTKRARLRLVTPSQSPAAPAGKNAVGARPVPPRQPDPVPEVRDTSPHRARRDLSEW